MGSEGLRSTHGARALLPAIVAVPGTASRGALPGVEGQACDEQSIAPV